MVIVSTFLPTSKLWTPDLVTDADVICPLTSDI